jgi:hypothetical protein
MQYSMRPHQCGAKGGNFPDLLDLNASLAQNAATTCGKISRDANEIS